MKQKFDVTGMTCSACSAFIEKSVRKLPDVKDVSVNLLQNSMQVEYDENTLSDAQIVHAVEDAGYGAILHNTAAASLPKVSSQTTAIDDEINSMKTRLTVSFVFLIPLMYLSMGHMMNLPMPSIFLGMENALTLVFTQFLLTIPILYVNRKYYTMGFKTLLKGAPNMDSLIAIGSGAAVVYGVIAIYSIGYGLGHGNMELVHQYMMDIYFESAGTILTLITVGKYLEAKSKGRTSDAITKLLDLAPKTALIIRNGEEVELPIEQVKKGDILVVKQGARVPVDGVIIEGNGALDESALTGESLPVEKTVNDTVIGATINLSGYFKMEAQKVGEDTTLAQIVKLVEDANSTKAPIAKLADKVSGIFVPTVIAIALLATIVWLLLGYPVDFAISIGIAVLVISCPCALGLATPTAIMVGTGKGAEHGILFKTAESLETTREINTILLDKTGTVTEGKPSVTDIITANAYDESALLTLAASAEKNSEHPLAKAIVAKAEENNVTLVTGKNFKAVAGQGIVCDINGKEILAGNMAMMQAYHVNISTLQAQADVFANEGKTVLYFAEDNVLAGMIAVADTIKPTSKHAIEQLQAMGLEVIMLTGDNRRTASAIQKQLGIEKVIAEVLPQDKEEQVRLLQGVGKKVAMVGDGINDAPALARADIGIAIGAGTDIAIESADLVLIKSNLEDVVTAIQLSKATIRNIKQNLFWAFFYNSLGIPLAAGLFYPLFGWKLNPMFGAAAMSLSSFFVVTNALRLKFFKPKEYALENHNVSMHDVEVPAHAENKNEGEKTMNKTVNIEGMTCMHCVNHVQKALEALDNVSSVAVDLEGKKAVITTMGDVPENAIREAITEAGYEMTGLE